MTDQEELQLLRAIVDGLCECSSRNQATDWKNRSHIPHHCDCPLYPVDLPDERKSPAAYADAMERRRELLSEVSR